MSRLAILPLIALLLGVSVPDASALEPHDRSGWYAGLGFGPAHGTVRAPTNEEFSWATGASPHLAVGRSVGKGFAVGLETQTWFAEVGTEGEGPADSPLRYLKIRLSARLLAGTVSWYPGSPGTAWGGLFLRAGAGPGLSSVAAAIPNPAEPESEWELQARVDEWGWGALGVVGYEFRVSRTFAVGVQYSYVHLWIDRDEIESANFGGPTLHLSWFF